MVYENLNPTYARWRAPARSRGISPLAEYAVTGHVPITCIVFPDECDALPKICEPTGKRGMEANVIIWASGGRVSREALISILKCSRVSIYDVEIGADVIRLLHLCRMICQYRAKPRESDINVNNLYCFNVWHLDMILTTILLFYHFVISFLSTINKFVEHNLSIINQRSFPNTSI